MEVKEYKKGDQYDIPEEGSLGLLALGYQGIVAWRCKKLGVEHTGEVVGPVLYLSLIHI